MGDSMEHKISVLDVDIDTCTAKEALKKTIGFMESMPVNIVEMVTVDGLMQMDEMPELKGEIRRFDLVMAGDRTILEAAEVTEKKYLQETEGQLFLKLFLRYLHKNHKRVYLLVESEEEGQAFLIICRNITKESRWPALQRYLRRTGQMICWSMPSTAEK